MGGQRFIVDRNFFTNTEKSRSGSYHIEREREKNPLAYKFPRVPDPKNRHLYLKICIAAILASSRN
jgi:hypothetical protein